MADDVHDAVFALLRSDAIACGEIDGEAYSELESLEGEIARARAALASVKPADDGSDIPVRLEAASPLAGLASEHAKASARLLPAMADWWHEQAKLYARDVASLKPSRHRPD